MAYSIGEVARLARISVRTLHHYDEIGLVRPTSRSDAGYRLYTRRDVERLQQALFYRELGFPLEEIARVLTDPAFDRRSALMTQRELLVERAGQVRALVALIDKTIEALDRGEDMTTESLFDGFDASRYEEEAKERWGGTKEYAESARRTRRYKKDDWKAIKQDAAAIVEAFAQAYDARTPATDAAAMDAAERHRQHISRWFYECSYEIHVGLGEMYVADPRFSASYDEARPDRPGLAQYIRDAIRANGERANG